MQSRRQCLYNLRNMLSDFTLFATCLSHLVFKKPSHYLANMPSHISDS